MYTFDEIEKTDSEIADAIKAEMESNLIDKLLTHKNS